MAGPAREDLFKNWCVKIVNYFENAPVYTMVALSAALIFAVAIGIMATLKLFVGPETPFQMISHN
jgi:hypothetical protein